MASCILNIKKIYEICNKHFISSINILGVELRNVLKPVGNLAVRQALKATDPE